MKRKVTIIGFGRFGKTLYRLLKDDFELTIYARHPATVDTTVLTKHSMLTDNLEKAYQSDTIFYAVPINQFASVIKKHVPYITNQHILIDVLSVKLHPKVVLEEALGDKNTQALLTHPMFGPDSSKDGFSGLPIIIDQFRTDAPTYAFWKTYLEQKQLNVIEMDADQHDLLAASSQGLTHFVGRLLEEYEVKPSPVDSMGMKKLLEVKEQTCHDTWELFTDLQHYNPYTKKMRLKLGEAYDRLYNKLLPKQLHPEHITIGIQGGKGSFNEEAVLHYLKQTQTNAYEIRYLYTTENVLAALHRGEIDRGQFAIHNSVGGIVDESIDAMAKYKFEIVEQFAIKISHALMIRPDASLPEITTIMTHPQVLAQCKKSLAQKYPHLKQTSGEGELIDHALVAKELAEKKLPKHIAVMGSKVLAQLYALNIVEDNLQDLSENYTSFLLVKRPKD